MSWAGSSCAFHSSFKASSTFSAEFTLKIPVLLCSDDRRANAEKSLLHYPNLLTWKFRLVVQFVFGFSVFMAGRNAQNTKSFCVSLGFSAAKVIPIRQVLIS